MVDKYPRPEADKAQSHVIGLTVEQVKKLPLGTTLRSIWGDEIVLTRDHLKDGCFDWRPNGSDIANPILRSLASRAGLGVRREIMYGLPVESWTEGIAQQVGLTRLVLSKVLPKDIDNPQEDSARQNQLNDGDGELGMP